MADATYEKFSYKKGNAIWETSYINSYIGKFTSGTIKMQWLFDTQRDSSEGEQIMRGWNDDFMMIGYSSYVWMSNGGRFTSGSLSGIFALTFVTGNVTTVNSFRPTLIIGNNI
ncbi:hypothetical protein D3C80_1846540 [compost metagenome]